MTDWVKALELEKELDTQKAGVAFESEQEQITDESFNREEVSNLCYESLDFLCATAVPEMFKFMLPPILHAIWSLLLRYVFNYSGEDKIALGIPRGHGKTTLVKLFILFVILFTKRTFVLILAETGPKAEAILSDVVDMLNETNIMRVFGDWKIGLEQDRQNLKKFGFRGRNIVLAALGAEGSVRGLNIKNMRPDVMIFEDIQSQECAKSDIQTGSLESWMVGTAMKAKSPHGCMMIFCGNMFPGDNCILKKLRGSKDWIKFISGAILADGNVLWPELRSFDSLIKELNSDITLGHPEIFFSEVMNDTEVGINNKVDLSLIKPWPWSPHELPQGKFIIIDPSANKKGGDDVSIGYFEVYDGIPALREIIEEKLSPGNTILRSLLLALKNRVPLIACEGTAYQSTLLYWFGEKCKDFGITGIEFVEVNTSSTSKNARIIEMLKSLPTGEIIIHDDVRAHVCHQIVNWNPLRRENVDGTLDLLAYTTQVLEKYEYAIATDTNLLTIESTGAEVEEGQWAF